MFSIYQVTNAVNSKKYIGQTLQNVSRYFRSDITRALKENGDRKPKYYNAIRKHGPDKFHIETIALTSTKYDADKIEKFFIKRFDTQESGYNIADGGGGSFGYKRNISDEHREKLRITSAGRLHTQEEKDKIAAAHLGKPKSEEHKLKLRKPKSEEAKRHMAIAAKQRIENNRAAMLSSIAKAREAMRLKRMEANNATDSC